MLAGLLLLLLLTCNSTVAATATTNNDYTAVKSKRRCTRDVCIATARAALPAALDAVKAFEGLILRVISVISFRGGRWEQVKFSQSRVSWTVSKSASRRNINKYISIVFFKVMVKIEKLIGAYYTGTGELSTVESAYDDLQGT